MMVLATGPELTLEDIPPDVLGPFSVQTVSTNALAPLPKPPPGGFPMTSFAGMNLADLERQAIEKTLEMVQGNREQAARILGIGERTLYRKIKEYGLKE